MRTIQARQGLIDQLVEGLSSISEHSKESVVESYYIFMKENNFPRHMSLVSYIKGLINIHCK